MGWYSGNSGNVTHNVGGKQANDFGLHDMHGNVWEWCKDVYNDDFYSSVSASGSNPLSAAGSVKRVFRGGGFVNSAQSARSAVRGFNSPTYRDSVIGFRPARPLP